MYAPSLSPRVTVFLKKLKRKDRAVFEAIWAQINKIIIVPELGKPLRNVLRGYRRVHIGSLVLVYETEKDTIKIVDIDHHDKIYKKYK